MTAAVDNDARRDELVERLFGNALGAMDLLCVYLGDRLGLYSALAQDGASTAAELASSAGIAERYAREWLEQQAMAGILETDDPSASDAERRYSVPAGHDEVLRVQLGEAWAPIEGPQSGRRKLGTAGPNVGGAPDAHWSSDS